MAPGYCCRRLQQNISGELKSFLGIYAKKPG